MVVAALTAMTTAKSRKKVSSIIASASVKPGCCIRNNQDLNVAGMKVRAQRNLQFDRINRQKLNGQSAPGRSSKLFHSIEQERPALGRALWLTPACPENRVLLDVEALDAGQRLGMPRERRQTAGFARTSMVDFPRVEDCLFEPGFPRTFPVASFQNLYAIPGNLRRRSPIPVYAQRFG
jgi:hypothetical protein